MVDISLSKTSNFLFSFFLKRHLFIYDIWNTYSTEVMKINNVERFINELLFKFNSDVYLPKLIK